MEDDTQGLDGVTEIPASEILAKIEKGELVDYDRVIIKGDIDISKLNLSKDNERFPVTSKIKLRAATPP